MKPIRRVIRDTASRLVRVQKKLRGVEDTVTRIEARNAEMDTTRWTWTCHVCGRDRPDKRISVYKRVMMRGRIEIQENVRYCNDNTNCIRGASNVRFLPPEDDES